MQKERFTLLFGGIVFTIFSPERAISNAPSTSGIFLATKHTKNSPYLVKKRLLVHLVYLVYEFILEVLNIVLSSVESDDSHLAHS